MPIGTTIIGILQPLPLMLLLQLLMVWYSTVE